MMILPTAQLLYGRYCDHDSVRSCHAGTALDDRGVLEALISQVVCKQ